MGKILFIIAITLITIFGFWIVLPGALILGIPLAILYLAVYLLKTKNNKTKNREP